jgi:hypothetical protein
MEDYIYELTPEHVESIYFKELEDEEQELTTKNQ